jgi:predicted ATP-grasp superfamily ATP-dependent carboligase
LKELSVLLVDAESSFALAVSRCLYAVPTVRVHALSRFPWVPLRFSHRCASFHNWGGVDSPGAADECSRIAQQVGADLGLAIDEPAIQFVASQRQQLPIRFAPTPSARSFDVTADKWALACFLRAHDLPHPMTTFHSTEREVEQSIRTFEFPVLLKPRRGSNGIGIKRFDDPSTLFRYLRDHAGFLDRYIVQATIPGRDVDCSVLCENGRILAHTIQRGFIMEDTNRFQPPGGVEFIDDQRVLGIVSQLMAALDWTGVAHVDLREDERSGQITILEVNPRFWGSVLGSLHAGVNFPYLACLAGLKLPFSVSQPRPCRYVSGKTAVGCWKRGQFGADRAGFGVSDTVFRDALRDPWPSFAELVLNVRTR